MIGRRARIAALAAWGAMRAALSLLLLGSSAWLPLARAAAQAAEDIRDIRGPKLGLPVWVLPAVLAGAVLLAAAAYGTRRWLVRRRRPRTLRPFEIALQRLEEARALMEPATAREFSIAVSDIVRSYIEQRFAVTATQRTTEEFLHDLLSAAHAALTVHRQSLADFLQQCDLVKFAGLSLPRDDLESLHRSARSFVAQTRDDLAAPEAHDALPAA